MTVTITEELSRLVAEVRYEDLSDEVRAVARHVTLDALGVMVAGAREPTGLGPIVKTYVQNEGAAAQCSVVTGGFKTSPQGAAFANGTLCHALDWDNTWWPVAHPTSPTLPAILAIAQARSLSGRRVIESLAAAFEVHGRVRLATEESPFGVGFHRNGLAGLMAAVAGVGRLLDLDPEQLCMAFGVGGSRAGSMAANSGTMTKSSSAGHAARMGVESAVLAEAGWNAHPDIFGSGGFFPLFFGEGQCKPELLLDGFGRPYRMEDPGVGFKKYPSNYFTHRAIDATLELAGGQKFKPDEIASVVIDGPPFSYIDHPFPGSGLQGKFSVQYVTALALLDGTVGLESFSDERLSKSDVQDLLPKVYFNQRGDIPLHFPTMHMIVTVILASGGQLSARCNRPKGMWGYPLSDAERLAKFEVCVNGAVTEPHKSRIVDQIGSLDSLKTVDSLMHMLEDAA